MTRIPREIVKAEAQARIEQVLAALGIHERPRGRYLSICNPVRGENKPSMQIWLNAGYEGAWKDHSNPDTLKGDVIDLVAYLRGWWDGPDKGFAKAMDFLVATLGLDSRAAPATDAAALARRRESQAKAQAADDERKARSAKALWLKGHDKLARTPVDLYLQSRGIDLKRLAHAPRAIRYLAMHPHRESGKLFPCMIAAMQDTQSERGLRAVHRTWIALDGGGKAPVDPPRKIWPAFAGCIVALSRGQSGLPVKEAGQHGIADTLVLCEGIEDGLSIAQADHQPRVWAAGSLGNLGNVQPPDCAAEILVAVDNDWGKPQAAAALHGALEKLKTYGLPVVTMRSTIGKDFNDLMKGAADAGRSLAVNYAARKPRI